jgi:hypothetical protein
MRRVHPSKSRFTRVSWAAALLAVSACAPVEDQRGPAPPIQPLPIATPQSGAVVASQGAAVSQNLAQAQITIVYNRPVARGRVVFGHLVEFGDLWHPGADQATYIRTTADVIFGGELLPAGTYSIWAVPNPEEWEFILHRDWNVFHLPFPGEEGVELRVRATPQQADQMESMAFYFPVADRRAGVLAFHWADTKLEIPIEAPGPDTN